MTSTNGPPPIVHTRRSQRLGQVLHDERQLAFGAAAGQRLLQEQDLHGRLTAPAPAGGRRRRSSRPAADSVHEARGRAAAPGRTGSSSRRRSSSTDAGVGRYGLAPGISSLEWNMSTANGRWQPLGLVAGALRGRRAPYSGAAAARAAAGRRQARSARRASAQRPRLPVLAQRRGSGA